MRIKVPVVPASFFGMVIGLAGLGTAWRWAHQVWGLPAVVGEAHWRRRARMAHCRLFGSWPQSSCCEA
jgi:hypothetical protein